MYLLIKLQLLLKVRTPFDPGNFCYLTRLPNRIIMNFPDGAPTHQSIGYDLSSSAWSLAYHCIDRMVPMIELTKGQALLSKLSVLQMHSALNRCEA